MNVTIFPTTEAPPFIREHFEAMAQAAASFPELVQMAFARWPFLRLRTTFAAVRFIPREPEAPDAFIDLRNDFALGVFDDTARAELIAFDIYLRKRSKDESALDFSVPVHPMKANDR